MLESGDVWTFGLWPCACERDTHKAQCLRARRRWTIEGWHRCPGRKGLGRLPADCNVIDVRGDKSYVYDLAVQRGIVSSRVALLLRSAEVKPLLSDLLLFFLFSFLLAGEPGKQGAGGRKLEAGSPGVVPLVQVCGMWCLSCGTLWHCLGLVWLIVRGGLFKPCRFP